MVTSEPTNPRDAGARQRPALAHFDVERVAYFSDAVMAIAMTLLVVDLRLPSSLTPTATDADLRAALESMGHAFLAFGLSFVVIATWWYGHHRLFRTLRAIDARLVVLDVLFLASIAFLPFPTTLIGQFVVLPTAVIVYAATNVVAGVTLFLMRWRAGRHGLFVDDLDPLEEHRRLVFAAVGWIGFAISIPLAVVAPGLAVVSWNGLWIAALALRWWFHRPEVIAQFDAG